MAESAEALAVECDAFTRYLVGQPATGPMTAYYQRAHTTIPYRTTGPLPAVDRALIRAAGSGRIALRSADAYARFFRPTGALRQKLTLCLAILENSPETHAGLNRTEVGNRWRVLAGVALSGVAFLCSLGLGVVIFGPLQLLGGARNRPVDA